MEIALPLRLVSNQVLVETIKESVCNSCVLLRRSDYIDLPSGELDSAIWSRKDLFGLSLNVFLCNSKQIGVSSELEDVRIVSHDERNVDFVSDEQLADISIEEIVANLNEKVILKMIYEAINDLSGDYPFGQVGTEQYKEFSYRLKVVHKPLLFNPFHYEIHVYSSENEFTLPLGREKLKGYQKSLASDIRNRILLEKLILPLG